MSEAVRRVAVVGNSHIGAITNGWKQKKDAHPEIALTFFGAIASELACLEIEKRALVPSENKVRESLRRTSGGLGRIIGDDFDEFLVVALDFSIYSLFRVYRTHRFSGLKGAAASDFLVSRAAFRLAMRDALGESLAVQIIRKIRRIAPGKRIVLVPQPHPRMVPDSTGKGVLGFGIPKADAPILKEIFDDVCREVAAAEGVELQEQGGETIRHDLWTADSFGADAANVIGGPVKKEFDFDHMGAAFGVHVLEKFVAGA